MTSLTILAASKFPEVVVVMPTLFCPFPLNLLLIRPTLFLSKTPDCEENPFENDEKD